ncbi:SF3a splicing factor complex subunit [Coemansia sp. RSA 552]|nr:SF3a splicing factor complex subunit [Coemansia sp. RSA 552]
MASEMIYPPVDVRTIVDKTAEHVAKTGAEFEQLMRDKYQGTAKFSFIYPQDPYYAYYAHTVEQFKTGKAPDQPPAENAVGVEVQPEEAPAEAAERPAPWQFVVAMPGASAQDLEVIKLTAQFAARNGRQFVTALAQREAGNYQFDFLSPQHSLFAYFRQLTDQYTLALFPPPALQSRVAQDIGDKQGILARAKRRMEWTAREEEERRLKAAEAERERDAFLAIDWHDFAVVGAVEFVEEDGLTDLPMPLRLEDLQAMSLADKHRVRAAAAPDTAPEAAPEAADEAEGDEAEDDDVEMEVDDDDDVDEEIEADRNPANQATPPVPELGLGPMKIRKDYVPRLRRGPQVEVALKCQLCGLDIPASEFDEHIRVELFDPRWKEQRLVYESKIRDSSLVSEGVDIARYLRRLAERGHDKDQLPEPQNKVVWDGYADSARTASRRARDAVSAENQAVAAGSLPGGRADDGTSVQIGPQMPPKRQRKK